jgi:hypothetical protein
MIYLKITFTSNVFKSKLNITNLCYVNIVVCYNGQLDIAFTNFQVRLPHLFIVS